jgi:hypothetical protein
VVQQEHQPPEQVIRLQLPHLKVIMAELVQQAPLVMVQVGAAVQREQEAMDQVQQVVLAVLVLPLLYPAHQ